MKKIGIVGHFDTDKNHFGIGAAYMLFFTSFGDVEIISPTETNVRKHLDLVVIPGGPDVDWKRYLDGDDRLSLFTGRPCNIRERFDEVLLPKYIEAGIPIFGICRGHQSIAVHFGAKLVQDMYHETNPAKDRKALVHNVSYAISDLKKFGLTPTFSNKNKNKEYTHALYKVNSIHHQVVKDCPNEAKVLARYSGDLGEKFIEALYYPNHKIITVQWHPEEVKDEPSIHFINHLLTLKDA